MRPRFSLRALLIFTAAFSVFSYYWTVMPRATAQRFVGAVLEQSYELADGSFRDRQDRFLSNWNEKYWHFKAGAELEQWSLSDFIRGERRVRLWVMYSDAGPLRALEWTVIATPAGMRSPESAMVTGISGGIAT
jgi:hypothetical protein